MKITAIYLLCSSSAALAFSPPATQNARFNGAKSASFLSAEPTETSAATAVAEPTTESINNSLEIPLSYNEMVLQASQCMSDAYLAGLTRQIVRILLPRDANADRLGVQFEADAQTDDRQADLKLVPNDESWQGGIMQLYRAASPTTKDILRQLCTTSATTGVPPRIIEDRGIDESGVDGVGLLYTQVGSSSSDDNTATNDDEEINGGGFGMFGESVNLPTLTDNDMCVFLQPNQEVAEFVDKLSTQTSPSTPLIALLNPQWRQVDDALDSASKSGGVFGAFASFLGGKGSVLRRLDELQYKPTFTLEGYVCKGGNIRLIKRFDSDWVVFAENDSGEQYVKVGSLAERPTYQDVEKMLDDKGVGYKYARDLGMAPKL
mmetsp:Transcript_4653/g.8331  ORF Transcript_4653/g.8331 Transcript_4653/m.8331 type:complete len:377 (-) Transcript_4653:186-1316(-)|eukprot:CAMPEP_0201624382 /NCGR_PEP_ID=MMETSP0493-20130528/602_1 /ASSEMBLY_ACC=CAM_ASM_000838 /TAXON_ID=420259 /ORGANISM="Thalassiosira gravida, Strain GMp14c1" /LENGTH=376 /DNA_ID=CAMNT_0048094231 /DNA_START=115 /DNA_END=1245 /DNA_ORIENTATION=-